MPKLYIIAGCNGAGKTTASYSLLPEMLECYQYVNSDEFAKYLSPFTPQDASLMAGRYMVEKIHYLMRRKEDFSIETTLATRSLMRTIEEAKSNGYTVTLLYFWLESPEMAVSRVKERVSNGGHDIPENIIRRRYTMGLQYFFNDYCPACDRWILADNSRPPFSVIAEGNANDTVIRDQKTYERIISDLLRQNQ